MNSSPAARQPLILAPEDRTPEEARSLGLAATAAGRSKPLFVGLLLGLVGLVGWVDFVTGAEVSVSFLYLIPILLGTWRAGRATGSGIALASASVWLGADLLAGHTYGHWLIALWDTLMFASSFLVVVALLASLREANEGLEQTVARRTQALQAENQERRRAEAELHQALGEVRRAHAELQRTQFQLIAAAKMESVARTATGVAHEVKNALMTLSLGTDYFLNRNRNSGRDKPDEIQLISDMKEAVHRASRVINVLLDYARPRPLQLGEESLHAVIENALALVRHQLIQQQVTVVREFHFALPPLSLDRTRIEHLFVNLFLNAVQAMPPGGTLTVRTLASTPTPFGSGGAAASGVLVEVDDTGHGILPENAGKLFEPFFTTKPPGQGTGLGLAIVRRIMEIHGGSIRLSNRTGGGARATLQFINHPKPEPKNKL